MFNVDYFLYSERIHFSAKYFVHHIFYLIILNQK